MIFENWYKIEFCLNCFQAMVSKSKTLCTVNGNMQNKTIKFDL